MTAELYIATIEYTNDRTPENRARLVELLRTPGQLTTSERREILGSIQ